MSDAATQLEGLRLAVGEVDALAAVALQWFDDSDWSGAEPLLVERAGFMLGVIARSAAHAATKIDGFHVAIADTQPAPAERWTDEGTAPGEDDQPAISDHDAEIIRQLRELAPDGRFADYSDAKLLQLFLRNRAAAGWTDEQVLDVMTRMK